MLAPTHCSGVNWWLNIKLLATTDKHFLDVVMIEHL